METIFYIKTTIKTATGFESFGQFFIGDDPEVAQTIFQQLKGTTEVSEDAFLQLDFIETRNGLPVNIKLIRCTLGEMGENCKIITRELFKKFALEG